MGAKLVVDAVIKVRGKINARDASGNKTGEAKINAEDIELISDEEVENYEATGAAMQAPKSAAPVNKRRYSSQASATFKQGLTREKGAALEYEDAKPLKLKKVFIQVDDPNDSERLVAMRDLCIKRAGLSEVILVFGAAEEKRAMRMPFRVEYSEELMQQLQEIYGEDKVKAV